MIHLYTHIYPANTDSKSTQIAAEQINMLTKFLLGAMLHGNVQC